MSIASAIMVAREKIANAYTNVLSKCGTLPVIQDLNNLSTAISTITSNPIIQVLDYDGTILKKEVLKVGTTFTLPQQPSHEGLIFQSWSSPVTITNNTITVGESNITIYASYIPLGGLSEFDIVLTDVTGLNVTLNMTGTKNWGDGASDDLTTHTYSSTGNYTITCDGNTNNQVVFGQNSSAKNYYAKKIRLGSNVTNLDITSIFAHCYSLEDVMIPNNVTTIGTYAFQYCYALENVSISNGIINIKNYAFGRCYSLKNITLPNSVTTIGNYAFQYCQALKNISLPDSITSLGQYAFQYCYNIENIHIPTGITTINNYVFDSCYSLDNIIIPDNITSIGNYAFQNCQTLKNIHIPNTVTSIGIYAFQYCYTLDNIILSNRFTPTSSTLFSGELFKECYALKNITIPDSVSAIGSYFFCKCYALENVTLPSTLTSLDTHAFENCRSLKNVNIPNGITTIPDSTFFNCYSLEKIVIPNTVTSFGTNVFANCKILKEINIPNGITTIPTSTFTGCSSLSNLTIPNTVTSFGGSAFTNCSSLTNITIPNAMTSILYNTFKGCSSLTEMIIPSGITTIGNDAFADCTSILEYDFSNHSVIPTLSNNTVFNNINQNCRIVVPWDLYENWKVATNWAIYADYIDTDSYATVNFALTPSGSVIYIKGQQIQGNSTTWKGPTLTYLAYNSTNNIILQNTQTNIAEGATVNITVNLTSYNKITLSTGLNNLTAKFIIDGVIFDATDEGNGNYYINTVGSNFSIDYTVNGSGYSQASGTITTTGSNITVEVTMQPAAEQSWSRPNLSSNGVVGGNSFAVYCEPDTYNDTSWQAVDGDNWSSWRASYDTPAEYIFYNPDPLKVSILTFCNGSWTSFNQVDIYGSSDGENWTTINSTYDPTVNFNPETGVSYTTSTLTNNNFYNYYKIVFTPTWSPIEISELQITATYMA